MTGKVMNKAESVPISEAAPLTKAAEASLRERATCIDDRVAATLRTMFATLDADRKERDAALTLLDALLLTCAWHDCDERATRRCKETPGPSGALCDKHDHGKGTEDEYWAPLLRALTAFQTATSKGLRKAKT